MNTNAWVAWVTMVMVAALSTTNPLVLGVMLLGVVFVGVAAPMTPSGRLGLRTMAALGAGLFAISLAIAVINGNVGERVLFTLPGPEVPSWLGGLRLGGPVSAEGLVAAGARGLAILCVFLAFAVFNGAVRPHLVMRSAPAALFHAGLVVTVGLNLLPASLDDLRRIREARALRGAPGGLRDLPAVVVPAVIGGLERSLRLAEAMEARGFASAAPLPRRAQLAGLAAAPLLMAAMWLWLYAPGTAAWALLPTTLAMLALGEWLRSSARARRTTRLTREPLSTADVAGMLLSAALALVFLVASRADLLGLRYNPFAGLPWPGFTPGAALLALGVAWPAVRLLAAPRTARTETARRPLPEPGP